LERLEGPATVAETAETSAIASTKAAIAEATEASAIANMAKTAEARAIATAAEWLLVG